MIPNHPSARTDTRFVYRVNPEAHELSALQLRNRDVKPLLRFQCGQLIYIGQPSKSKISVSIYATGTAKRVSKRRAGCAERLGNRLAITNWTPAIFVGLIRLPGAGWWAEIFVNGTVAYAPHWCIAQPDAVHELIRNFLEHLKNSSILRTH
jgi:hypothetical protein